MNKKVDLGIAVIKEHDLNFYILNSTPYPILAVLYLERRDGLDNLYSGLLAPKEYYRLKFSFREGYRYRFKIGYLCITAKCQTLPTYQKWNLNFSSKKLKQNCSNLPVLNRVGWFFSILKPEPRLDLKNIMTTQTENKPASPKVEYPFAKPEEIIDLHIDKLDRDYKKMKPDRIKEIQLETFKKRLHEAIAYNMSGISFIHGIGNQILSKDIHTYLESHKDVKDFSTSDFNSGLTHVELH